MRKRHAVHDDAVKKATDVIHRSPEKIWVPSSSIRDEHQYVRPYFLIRPQTVLVLPNETGMPFHFMAFDIIFSSSEI